MGKIGSGVKRRFQKTRLSQGFQNDLKMKSSKSQLFRLIYVWCIAALCDLPQPCSSTSVKIFKKQSTFHLIRATKMKRNPLEIKIMKEFRLEGWTVAAREESSWFLHICLDLMSNCLGLGFSVPWREKLGPGLSQWNQDRTRTDTWWPKHCYMGKISYG